MLILWVLLLQLVSAPFTTGQEQKVFAQVGGSVTLKKGKFSETENVYVKWFFSSIKDGTKKDVLLIWKKHNDGPKSENKDWQNRVSLSEDSALTISPILESDFDGVFKCEQDNFRGSAAVFYRLNLVEMPMKLLLLVGEELSLKCMIGTTVTWTAPNGTTYINRLSGNKNILRVPNTSIKDSGVWACEGTNKFKATTAVTILGLSPPPSDTVYTSVSPSASATLPCSLSADVSWSQLREKGLQGGSWNFTPLNQSHQQVHLDLVMNKSQAWRAQNPTSCLTEKELKNHDLSVRIPRVLKSCRGTYQCSLEFGSKTTMSRTVKLEVLEVLSSALKGVKLMEGDPVNLNCSLGVPLPSDLRVKWTPPKSSAFSKPEPHGVHLLLPAVSVKDSGQWKCELIKKTAVLTSASVTLKIEKLVSTWVFVTIGSVSIFISLLVIALIIIRRRRQITTRHKTRFCCCKNPQPKGFYKS